MLPIKAILWPTDASKSALRALEAAIELAETFGAKIYALQIVSQVPTMPEPGFGPGTASAAFNVPLYEQELLKSAATALEKTITDHVPDKVAVESAVLIGWPSEVIIDYGREKGVDLIVMATHGRTGISHLMMGSVAERTIRESSIPTLIVPATTME